MGKDVDPFGRLPGCDDGPNMGFYFLQTLFKYAELADCGNTQTQNILLLLLLGLLLLTGWSRIGSPIKTSQFYCL